MKKYILAFLLAACTLLYLPAWAQLARQLTWDDLIPAKLLAEDPLAKLSKDQQDMAYWVINMLESMPKRGPQTEEDYKQIDEAMPALRQAGIKEIKQQVLALGQHDARQNGMGYGIAHQRPALEHQTLDVPWDEVHGYVEKMEHAIDEHLTERIDAYLGFPQRDPHGSPIPQAGQSNAAPQGVPLGRKMAALIRVEPLPPGERY
jgi:hypothetical protein